MHKRTDYQKIQFIPDTRKQKKTWYGLFNFHNNNKFVNSYSGMIDFSHSTPVIPHSCQHGDQKEDARIQEG